MPVGVNTILFQRRLSAGSKGPQMGIAHRRGRRGTGFVLFGLLVPVLIFSLWVGMVVAAEKTSGQTESGVRVFVTIPPQRYFVERIGGDRVVCSVLVEPGQSPETFEPSPQRLVELSRAEVFFRIGIGFEASWLERVRAVHPGLRIVDTREGVRLLEMGHEGHGTGQADPHIWLDPARVRVQAQNIERGLAAADPAGAALYSANLSRFLDDLAEVDAQIRAKIQAAGGRKFLVWHPAWGYFAEAYGLEQVAVEEEGKEPNAKSLASLLDRTRREGFRMIFVSEETRSRAVESFAKAAGLSLVRLDPLSMNYLDNLRFMADRIAEGLR